MRRTRYDKRHAVASAGAAIREEKRTLPPRVLVVVEGGNVSGVITETPARVIILDYDNIKQGDPFDGHAHAAREVGTAAIERAINNGVKASEREQAYLKQEA